MAKFVIEELSSRETFITSGGETIELHVRRLGRVAKVDAAVALSRGDAATAESIVLRHSVTGWSGVVDACGAEVKFSQEALDALLGSDDALGRDVSNHLFRLNRLADAAEEPGPLEPANGTSST